MSQTLEMTCDKNLSSLLPKTMFGPTVCNLFVVQANMSITDKFLCCFLRSRGGFVALSPISPQDLFMQPLAQDSMEERDEYQHHYQLQSMVGETKYTKKYISP